MLNQSAFTLVNQQNGNLAFKLFSFDDNSHFDHVQRNNYFSLVWVKEGSGKLKADFNEYDFEANCLFAFTPYQPFMFKEEKTIKGIAIHFHPEFFCIYKHHKEVSCNGVLYNNIYNPPFVTIDPASAATLEMICQQIKIEMQNPELAQYELLVSYLKIFFDNRLQVKNAAAARSNARTEGSKRTIYSAKA